MPEIPKTLFLGLGSSVVSYYRCFLPAVALGADYAIWGDEHAVRFGGGFGDRPPRREDLFDYDVVVLQYGSGKDWLKLTRQLQDAGVTVLYEIDDYVHSARKSKTHEMAGAFGADRLRNMEMVMRVADGIICSTGFIARRYRSFNPRTWECRNGIDLKRYEHRKPPRSGVTIGWAGGVGHKASLARWEPAIRNVLRARPEARFMSVGHNAAADVRRGVRLRARRRLPDGRHRGLPGDDVALRPLDRALGREQPVPRQERPALARGERDRDPARGAPRRLPGHRGRRDGRARLDAGRGRGRAAAPDRQPRGARAHRAHRARVRRASTGASRSWPRAGARSSTRSARRSARA